jgi:flagellar biosynthesis/type III secretory pathway chaperone
LDASSILSGYGLAGLVILALAITVKYLYGQLQQERAKRDLEHEARVTELRESNTALEASNARYQETVAKLAQISENMTNSRPPLRG